MSDIKAHRVRTASGSYGHTVSHTTDHRGSRYLVRLLDGPSFCYSGSDLTWSPSEWPTDTGVIHGPAEMLAECAVCYLPLRHVVHSAAHVSDGSGHAFRVPRTSPVLGHRIPGTSRTI